MSAFHRRLIAEEFARRGGTLTRPQLADVAGPRWIERVREMRAHGYPLVGEDAAGLWHLDLDELPVSDVGRDGDHDEAAPVSAPVEVGPGSPAPPVAVSPDAGPVPLFDAPAVTVSPLDPDLVEAA